MFSQVLVVDDSPVDRSLVGGLLEDDPFIKVSYASNGAEALELLDKDPPRLVLTDMLMPVMDGLDLVEAIVTRRPVIPVVIMTGIGTADAAAKALSAGAANFIPKTQVDTRLLNTVQRILGISHNGYDYERLVPSQTRIEQTFYIETKPVVLEALLGLVDDTASCMGFADMRGRTQMQVAVEQALLNAMYHGNLELKLEDVPEIEGYTREGSFRYFVDQHRKLPEYADRKILIEIRMTRSEAHFRILDEGPGFDTSTIPDPNNKEVLNQQGGLGLVLMQLFMDKVEFNNKGNEVKMVKKFTCVGNKEMRVENY